MKTIKNILVAPDKFKFTFTAREVVDAICNGLTRHENINILKFPLADGGEGTSDILSDNFKAEKIYISVNNPLFKKVDTYYYFSEDNKTAIIDIASASGLNLLKEEDQNPLFTTSYGTGEIILDTIKKGAKKIIIGMGGSSTNDFGIGAFNALGYRFLDDKGEDLPPIGKNLIHISKIDDSNVNPVLKNIEIIALYDVENTLYGKNGSAYTYAKQKGANKEEIKILDLGLRNVSELIKFKFNMDVSKIKGGGAAGGLGAGLFAFFDAKLQSGSKFIFQILEIEKYIKKADLILTGEGKFDKQSLQGKIVGELISKAKKYNKQIAIICGISEISKNQIEYEQLKIYPLFKNFIDIEIAKQKSYNLIVGKVKNEIAHDFLF